MKQRKWTRIGAYLIGAFFIIGALGNIFPPDEVRANYLRWGYPSWFHYVTGALELAAAVLLFSKYRLWGSALGASIMLAAAGTVLINGELTHSIPPLVVLTLCAILAFAIFKHEPIPSQAD
ncbi:DoxX family protein [Asticcacaulis sp. W401b]|uniref:DoxX family protein n=1 Tax=Asticcacaulis sp. W401b TaxID=3388666 RepID=UPI003970EB9B